MLMGPATTVESLRLAHRELRDRPAAARLWQAMSMEWQRVVDRRVTQSVLRQAHEGVREDYFAARAGR